MSQADDTLTPLDAGFFNRPTVVVAKALLGHWLVVQLPEQPRYILKIVETEAYTQDDPACHAYGRKTGRAANLYKSPGLAYVYFIYGMYACLNVVTEPEGSAGAVLIRGLDPMGHDLKTNGPGRLTKALDITVAGHNGLNMTDRNSRLYFAQGDNVETVIETTRIGITKAVDYPWRFYIEGNPWVSVLPPKRSL